MENIKNNIAFLQVSLSFLRDLTLTVVVILTIVVFYFGGNPKNLTYLDWAELIMRSFGIVLIPFIVYFFLKYLYKLSNNLLYPYLYLYGTKRQTPRIIYLYISTKLFKINYREYVNKWREYRRKFKIHKDSSQINKFTAKLIETFVHNMGLVFEKHYPWLGAVVALIFSCASFINAVNQYIPVSLGDIAMQTACSNKNFNMDWLLRCAP